MRTFFTGLLLIFISMSLRAAPDHAIENFPWPKPPECSRRDSLPHGQLSGFAQGVKTPSFAARYAPALSLPVPEERLLDLADKFKLQIVLFRSGTDALCARLPQWQAVNDDSIQKVYLLLDSAVVDSGSTHVRYTAFVNKAGMVVYIEPSYTYD